MGHDNKHWLAMPGDDRQRLCCLDSEKSHEVRADCLGPGWVQVFLRSVEAGTSLLAVDSEGYSHENIIKYMKIRQVLPTLDFT